MRISVHSGWEGVMGRANVYLPDELERRVKAAQIPISEVCQRALLAAVEAAENGLLHVCLHVFVDLSRRMAVPRWNQD